MGEEPVKRSAMLDAPLSLGGAGESWEETVDRERALDRFLAGVERSALRIARMALRDHAETEDAVQDAMIRLVRHYAQRPEDQWRPQPRPRRIPRTARCRASGSSPSPLAG